MSSEDERFDALFLGVAQQSQGIEPLLDSLFAFLRRKTDFFTGASQETVEELVLRVLRKQAALAERTQQERKAEREREERRKAERRRKKQEEEEARRKAKAQEEGVVEISADGTFDISEPPVPAAAAAVAVAAAAAAPAPATAAAAASTSGEGQEGDQKEATEDNTPPPPGNGGITDRYVWTQTLGDLNVVVPVPEGTKSKQVVVDISSNRLRVGLKGSPPIIDGQLHKRVKVDDSFWTLEDGKEISVSLQKDNTMEWWKCVVQGDPEIDTTKVQPENSQLSDLDADTRQTVEKMMFDQRQKALGLPTADELQKQELLKKFMDAHPEMDFSKAKIT